MISNKCMITYLRMTVLVIHKCNNSDNVLTSLQTYGLCHYNLHVICYNLFRVLQIIYKVIDLL